MYKCYHSSYLDDRSDELQKEARYLQQTRPEVVDEVDDQTLDVRPIMVLVSHDHQVTIPAQCTHKYNHRDTQQHTHKGGIHTQLAQGRIHTQLAQRGIHGQLRQCRGHTVHRLAKYSDSGHEIGSMNTVLNVRHMHGTIPSHMIFTFCWYTTRFHCIMHVPEALGVSVDVVELEAKDSDNIGDLLILGHHRESVVTHIQRFALVHDTQRD